MIVWKAWLSAIAITMTVVVCAQTVVKIWQGTVKPHVFSWVIWGSTTFVVFFAQLAGQGGLGAWPIGVSGVCTIVIAALAFHKRGEITITRSDWFFLVAALSALPLWYVTADPLIAVVILTVVDVLGFGPTLRKAYGLPYSESMVFYSLFATRNALAVMATEHYSLVTVLFPAAIGLMCLVTIAVLGLRRWRLEGSGG